MKLDELFGQFLQERRYMKAVSPKTLISYQCAWKAFRLSLPAEIDEKQLRPALKQAVIALRQRKPSATQRAVGIVSINNYITHINALTAWMLAEGHISESVKLEKLKEAQKLRKTLDDDQVRQFANFKPKLESEKRVHMMGLVVLDAGLRLDEVRKLKRKDINFDQMYMLVFKGKGNKQRNVPFSIELRKRLFKWVVSLQNDDYLFITSTGRLLSIRNAIRDLNAIGAHLKIERIGFHKMRHTMATNYLRQGGTLSQLRRILGHTSIQTTMIYESLQTEDLTRDYQSFSLLNKIKKSA